MTLQGKLVVMSSCSLCGTSWADGAGRSMALSKVLKLASPGGR